MDTQRGRYMYIQAPSPGPHGSSGSMPMDRHRQGTTARTLSAAISQVQSIGDSMEPDAAKVEAVWALRACARARTCVCTCTCTCVHHRCEHLIGSTARIPRLFATGELQQSVWHLPADDGWPLEPGRS